MANPQKRQTAYKAQIKDIVCGDFIRAEGWNPNYIIDKYNRKISRINLISAIVDISGKENTFNYCSLALDDGTGRITARIFEEHERLKGFSVGDIILIIGRIREYGKERYILPEIIKKIHNPIWIDLRKKEIEILQKSLNKKLPESEKVKEKKKPENNNANQEDKKVEEEEIVDMKGVSGLSEKINSIIRELDCGEGADIDEVISKSGVESCEDMINSLLLEGDIFEIKPGRLKVLD